MKKNRVVIILGVGLLLIIAAFLLYKYENKTVEEIIEPGKSIDKNKLASEEKIDAEEKLAQEAAKSTFKAGDDEQRS